MKTTVLSSPGMRATRILLPIAAAVLVVAAVAAVFWWQIRIGAEEARRQAGRERAGGLISPSKTMPTDGAVDASDLALLHLRQGDLAWLRGAWAEAEREYDASVKNGGSVVALRKLAQVQLQRREIESARATVERLRRAGARSDDLLLLEVAVLLRTGEPDRAVGLLAAASDTPQKHYGLALLGIVRGNHEEVQSQLRGVAGGWDPLLRSHAETLERAYREFAEFPDSREIHLDTLLARALAEVQECELALPLLSHAIGEQDDYRDAWIVQGYCELATERYAQARASLERAYSLDPEKPEIQFFLGKAHAALGDHRVALQFFQYALKNGLEPQKEVRQLIAAEAEQVGEPLTALEQYRKLAEGEGGDVEAFESYVGFALKIGQVEDALDAAAKAAKRWPDDAAAHELLGDALLAAGKPEEARSALTKALELDPTRESAREKLKQLE